jgi:hypothetical protein
VTEGKRLDSLPGALASRQPRLAARGKAQRDHRKSAARTPERGRPPLPWV